jgi:hypothetical protein
MKKTIITSLAILISIGGLSTAWAKSDNYINELAYFKTINPAITQSEVESLMKLRKQVDKIHEQSEKLELEYGILVDNTKDPNKEPRNPEELTAEQRNKLSQANIKFWNGELAILEASYKAGLISEDNYKIDKKSFEKARDNN